MQQLIAELARPTILCDRTLRNLAQLKRAHGEYLQARGQEPSGNQLASDTDLSYAQVAELPALERIQQSMDEPRPVDLAVFEQLLVGFLSQWIGEQLAERAELTLGPLYLDRGAALKPQRARADDPSWRLRA